MVLVNILSNLRCYKNTAVASYLMVTGVSSKIVVTLSRNAEIQAAKAHKIVIRGHVFPFAITYACITKRSRRTLVVNLRILRLGLPKNP